MTTEYLVGGLLTALLTALLRRLPAVAAAEN